MGKPGLENREDSILKDTSWHIWTVRSQMQRRESIVIRYENAQKKNSWIAKLVEEMKPVVVEKDDFQFRDNSKVLAFFWNFGTDKILMQKKSLIWFANQFSQNSSRYETGRYQASSYGELRVSISRWNVKNSNIWNIRLSAFQCNLKKRHFFRGEWLHTTEALNWHSHRRNEACTYVRQMRMSLNIEKNFWKRFFFGIFRTLKILMQGTKSTIFHSFILFYKCSVSDAAPHEGTHTSNRWGIQDWILSEMRNLAIFGDFGMSKLWCREIKSTIVPSKKSLNLESFRCRHGSNR